MASVLTESSANVVRGMEPSQMTLLCCTVVSMEVFSDVVTCVRTPDVYIDVIDEGTVNIVSLPPGSHLGHSAARRAYAAIVHEWISGRIASRRHVGSAVNGAVAVAHDAMMSTSRMSSARKCALAAHSVMTSITLCAGKCGAITFTKCTKGNCSFRAGDVGSYNARCVTGMLLVLARSVASSVGRDDRELDVGSCAVYCDGTAKVSRGDGNIGDTLLYLKSMCANIGSLWKSSVPVSTPERTSFNVVLSNVCASTTVIGVCDSLRSGLSLLDTDSKTLAYYATHSRRRSA